MYICCGENVFSVKIGASELFNFIVYI
jgi:hypothetical protein